MAYQPLTRTWRHHRTSVKESRARDRKEGAARQHNWVGLELQVE